MPHSINNATCLIGIGAQKAGSTWLGDYFERHPDIAFTPLKELHFYNEMYIPELTERVEKRFSNALQQASSAHTRVHVEARIAASKQPNHYLSYFETFWQGEPVFGEITPCYALLKAEHWREINNTVPNLKVIYLLRNPADRVWSHLKMQEKLSGGEREAMYFLDIFPRVNEVMSRTHYAKTLDSLYQSLRPDQIFVDYYEHLFSSERHARTLQSITDFLGVTALSARPEEYINRTESRALTTPQRNAVVEKLAGVYQDIVDSQYISHIPACWQRDLAMLAEKGMVRTNTLPGNSGKNA